MWKATQRATDIENSWEARGFRGLSAGVACVFLGYQSSQTALIEQTPVEFFAVMVGHPRDKLHNGST